mgnify:CR=1 FL=1
MKVLKPLTNNQVGEQTQTIFSSIKQRVGRVPNLYAAMANSPNLLGGFLVFEATLKQCSFSAKENEAIALAVQAPSVSNTPSWSVGAYREPHDTRAILKLQAGTVGHLPVPVLLAVTVDLRHFTGSNARN